MTSKITININSVSKTFRLYDSKSDFVKELVHPLRKKFHKPYHALKDISFSVGEGEVVGIIGKNGSGKSTLLKILASVVTPTSGTFICKGRVAALLELGAGFDTELTGIQNIEFLGTLMGFPKNILKTKIKEIIKFAEIDEYANQPVRSYSSGMYMRLAFSLSVNIDPEILIIDEILAVGDIKFQQKSFNKIKNFKERGKTILLCTHDLNMVNDFCTRAIWIHNGIVKEDGNPKEITKHYNDFMILNNN